VTPGMATLRGGNSRAATAAWSRESCLARWMPRLHRRYERTVDDPLPAQDTGFTSAMPSKPTARRR